MDARLHGHGCCEKTLLTVYWSRDTYSFPKAAPRELVQDTPAIKLTPSVPGPRLTATLALMSPMTASSIVSRS